MMINRHVTGRFTYFKQAIFFLLIATSCQNRDKIAFKDATGTVQDSIFMMRKYMMTFIPREVNNFFYDHGENFFINNVKIGRFDEGDSKVLIDSIQMETGFSRQEASKFVALSLFLKDNYLDGCQRNGTNGAYFFSYKKTSSNERNDVREIIVDTDFGRTYVAGNQEHYVVVDKTGRLVLLRLPPKE